MKHKRRTVLLTVAPWITSALILRSAPASTHEAQPVKPETSPKSIAAHPSLAIIKPAPDFTLLDSAGRRLALSELRGRVVLLSFIYTSCTTTCPLLAHQMALLEDRLRHAKFWPSSVSFLSVTVDPERDSAQALQHFARRFEATDLNWRFLREQSAHLRPVLAAYGEWTRPLPNGDLDHPARVYLIDRRGTIREIYALSFFDERQVFIDIQSLLKEGE